MQNISDAGKSVNVDKVSLFIQNIINTFFVNRKLLKIIKYSENDFRNLNIGYWDLTIKK